MKKSRFVIVKRININSLKGGVRLRGGKTSRSRKTGTQAKTPPVTIPYLNSDDGARLYAGFFSAPPGYKSDDKGVWVSHREPEVSYVFSGRYRYQLVSPTGQNRKELIVSTGDLVYLAPGTYHRGRVLGRESFTGIEFSPSPNGATRIITEDSKLRKNRGK